MEFRSDGTWRRAGPAVAMCALLLSVCSSPTPAIDSPNVALAAPNVVAEAPEVASFSLPDITARAITSDDLVAMLPGDPDVAVRSNEQLVIDALFDRSDQADDVVTHGRVTGISGHYPRTDGSAHVWIDVLQDPEAAHAYLVDLSGDMAKGIDGTHQPDVGIEPVADFAADTGEEAFGLIGTLATGDTETMIVTRIGRLVIFASEVRASDADMRVAVQYLVDDTVEGVLDALSEDAIDLSPETSSYRFETTIDVMSTDNAWRTTAAGIVDGQSRTCSLSRATPLNTTSASIVRIDGVHWVAEPSGSRYARTGASTLGPQLLVWCPPWPLTAEAAGLAQIDLGADPPRHHVNGFDATGYAGDATDLAAALGIDTGAITLDSFAFWVADGTDWIVELSLIATGPARSLEALIGSEFADGGELTVTLRHRVFDIGSTDPVLAPN